MSLQVGVVSNYFVRSDFDNEKMKTAQKNIDSAKYFSVGEDYDVIPKVAGRRQGSDSISRLSRNRSLKWFIVRLRVVLELFFFF